MKFYIPAELTDPMVHEVDCIPHGESVTIDVLSAEVERRRAEWMASHPGWTYTGTSLVKAHDGSPSPAYDVQLCFRRTRTPAELEAQAREREAYVEHKKADFARREQSQKELLERVLGSLNP